jgi:hypothetical protein
LSFNFFFVLFCDDFFGVLFGEPCGVLFGLLSLEPNELGKVGFRFFFRFFSFGFPFTLACVEELDSSASVSALHMSVSPLAGALTIDVHGRDASSSS